MELGVLLYLNYALALSIRMGWGCLTLKTFQFKAFAIPSDSPLRRAQSLFWGVRTNDEGIGRRDGRDFHQLVNAGVIDIVAPARVSRFGDDGRSVVLKDGTSVRADAVILGTGYTSSWDTLFDGPIIILNIIFIIC